VGLGAYNMDSHNCQRLVQSGWARNEGDVQVGVAGPYPVSYRSIVPKAAQAENLFVPVALAATHIAYGSIRMEPVFMAMGQSAATAASMAIDARVPVQKVEYARLRERLLVDGQILDWTGPARPTTTPVDPKSLPGLVLDDAQAEYQGEWTHSTSARFIGSGYRHDGDVEKGSKSATFRVAIPTAGSYECFLLYPPLANRASNVPVTVAHGESSKTVRVNQKKAGEGNATSLGTYRFTADQPVTVTVSNQETDGYVIVDGVQFVPR
jgi:hypothetical protein